MKRQILTLGAICAAAFTLTNCNKEIAEPKAPVTEGIPFEIVAATADTKTENDGLNTKWTTGDALNVFHAEAGSIDYGTNDQFKYTGADNKFKGTLKTALGGGKSYDWYALYPYDNRIKNPTGTPFGTGGNYTLIGKKNGKDTGDTQDGNDSKAHLSGKSCPMYAVAENVAASDVPTFTMKHLTSVVAVTVTNANDAPLTVNSVSFSAPEGTTIFGSFFINFTENGDAVYTNHGTAAWTSNTSNLTVKNGTPIAKNGKATFYLAIKPFAAKTGDELKISVNGYEKTRKLTEDVEFKAGKIETVNFKYNNSAVVATPHYKADFEGETEHRTSGTNSYTSNTYTVSGVKWELKYADAVTSGSPLSGSAHVICRIAKDTKNKPYILSENLLSKSETVTKVSFLSELGPKASLVASYSIDNGSTWNPLTITKDATVHATLGYSASLTGVTASDFRLKFEWSRTGTAKVDSKIDDICVFTE